MKYHNITHDDMLNGEGLRVVLWVSGCEHRCLGCQNPITWDKNIGLLFDKKAKEEIFDSLKKPYIQGITFSGGDPLYASNINEITTLAKEIKALFPTKDIWLYTGYTWHEIKDLEIIKYIDILIDGKFKKDLKNDNLLWRGSSNQKVIDVKNSINKNKIVLYTID